MDYGNGSNDSQETGSAEGSGDLDTWHPNTDTPMGKNIVHFEPEQHRVVDRQSHRH